MIRTYDMNMNNAESDIARLARNSRALVSNSSRLLASNFVPGPGDVICSRGKEAMVHEGNKTFKRIIAKNLDNYAKATSKMDKSVIVSGVIDQIRGSSPDGGFVRKERGQWVEVGDHVAREKVGQTMRDMLSHKYKSSTKSKKNRRKEIQAKQNDEIDDFLAMNCPDITERVRQLSVTAQTEDELQAVFNQANCELLDALKRARTERTMAAFSTRAASSRPSGAGPVQLSATVNESKSDANHSLASTMTLHDAVDDYHLKYQKL